MHAATPPTYTLLDRAFVHLTRELCRALPPPPTEHEQQSRNEAAIAQVASLQPNSTAEFELAATAVCASFRARHCQVRADEPGQPSADALRWTGKADQMMRQAQSAMRSLLRVQALRQNREADPRALDRGERAEHHMLALMTEAIGTQPPISYGAPESQTAETEILPRHSAPNAGATIPDQTPHDPEPVSYRDPESPHAETEIHPRLAAPERAPHTLATQPVILPGSVSFHDPESHTPETETQPRLLAARTDRWRPLRPGYDFPLSDLAEEDEEAFGSRLHSPVMTLPKDRLR